MTRITLLIGVAALLLVAYGVGKGQAAKAPGHRPGGPWPAPEDEGTEGLLARLELTLGVRPGPFSCN